MNIHSHLLRTLCFLLLAQTALAKVSIPPAPTGYPVSTNYAVLVNGREVPVFNARIFYQLQNPNRVVSWSQFDFTGKVAVEVVVPRKVDSVRIRPTSAGINYKLKGSRISFSLDKPTKLSIEINGGIEDNLHLFANLPELNPPKPGDTNVLYYGPGIHYVDGGYGILTLKSNQVLYLAAGAVLRARVLAEYASHITIRGRGILEGSTLLGRQPDYYREFNGEPATLERPNFVQFNHCSNVKVEGVILNDAPAWTLVFNHCDGVLVENIKEFGYVDNTDGVDIQSSRNVVIRDIFSRINDDNIAIKSHGDDVFNVLVENSVLWSDRAVPLQIGHETISSNITHVTFRNIDILEQRNRYIGHYAMGVFNGDHATVSDVLFDDIRVENCERLIGLTVEKGFFNQSDRRGRIENIRFRNIRSSTTCDLHLYGFDETSAVRNISFENLTVNGKPAQPELFANFHVHDLVFQQPGKPETRIASIVKPGVKFVPLDISAACNRSRTDEKAGDGRGCFDLGPENDLHELKGGVQTLGGVPFNIPPDGDNGAIVLRSSQHLINQPFDSHPVKIGRKADYLYFLHVTAFTDIHVDPIPPEVWIGKAGKLLFHQSPIGTPLWYYIVRYSDDGTEISIPVQAGNNVEDWQVWAPSGWVVHVGGKKIYIQQWTNPFPEKPIDYVKVRTALRPEVPAALGITLGMADGL